MVGSVTSGEWSLQLTHLVTTISHQQGHALHREVYTLTFYSVRGLTTLLLRFQAPGKRTLSLERGGDVSIAQHPADIIQNG